MNDLYKKVGTLLAMIFMASFVLLRLSSVQVLSEEMESFDAASKSAIAIDFETGKILYGKDSDKVRGIASMTKIITVYLLLEKIKEGKLNWEDKVEISNYSYELSTNYNLSGVPMELNRSYSVKELYEAALIASANNAAVAIAEKISGTEKEFVDLMREKLNSWGIKDAYIVNSTGLNNEDLPKEQRYPGSKETDENLMSARGMALVAQRLIKDFPKVLDTTKLPHAKFGVGTASEVEMTSWNWMLKGMRNDTPGVDGLKTGTTKKAGQCFVGTSTRKNWRIITVVQNAEKADVDEGARFTATKELMDFVYKNWSQKTVVQAGKQFTAARYSLVKDGKTDKVPLKLKEDVKLWVQKGMNLDQYQVLFVGKEAVLKAPVDEGETAGDIELSMTEDKWGYVGKEKPRKYEMITSEKVEKANFFALLVRHMMDYINEHLG